MHPQNQVRSKNSKSNSEVNITDQSETDETINLKSMMKAMMQKLEKLDSIDTRVKTIENDLKSVKESIEFTHAEIKDLKKKVKLESKLTKQQSSESRS